MLDGVRGLADFREAEQEVVDGGGRHVEREHLEHQLFHPEHLLLRVRVVRDEDKLRHLRRVDLLKLPAAPASDAQIGLQTNGAFTKGKRETREVFWPYELVVTELLVQKSVRTRHPNTTNGVNSAKGLPNAAQLGGGTE